jgi:hypothetical protein
VLQVMVVVVVMVMVEPLGATDHDCSSSSLLCGVFCIFRMHATPLAHPILLIIKSMFRHTIFGGVLVIHIASATVTSLLVSKQYLEVYCTHLCRHGNRGGSGHGAVMAQSKLQQPCGEHCTCIEAIKRIRIRIILNNY